MLDAIHIGMSGLLGSSEGLRVIANNTANLNTPGFKGSTLQFTDLLHAQPDPGGGAALGYGLATAGATLDWRQGDLRASGNANDLGIDGNGLFVLQDSQGRTRYSRAGEFEFNAQGAFVHRIDGSAVMGVDATGQAAPISLASRRTSAGQATATVRLAGNLSSTSSTQTVDAIKVFDGVGTEHTLTLKLTNTSATTPGSWQAQLLEGDAVAGSAEIVFTDGLPSAATTRLAYTYTPAGRPAQALTLDFSQDVTSYASGNLSTLALSGQDGFGAGSLSQASFDDRGTLVLTYSNGQKVHGPRLQLAMFPSADAVQALGGNLFAAAPGPAWTTGLAGEGVFGAVRAGTLEIANVDMSREFSNLIVLQRGYQASSQVISTANDMLQELFQMKGR